MTAPQRLIRPPVPPFSDDGRNGGRNRHWIMPVGLVAWSDHLKQAGFHRLAGGMMGFSHLDVLTDHNGDFTIARIETDRLLEESAAGGADAESLAGLMLDRLTRPRPDFASLGMDRWHVMGIINTTPDSFSDGGDNAKQETAIASGRAMVEAGAAILDIGGESTRPGAEPVSRDEEQRRILPVIRTLSDEGHLVSADTRHTAVMASALDHGAGIINDVGGLRDDGAADLVASRSVPTIIMHMQGEPGTMQKSPRYRHAPTDIFDWLEARIDALRNAGIGLDRIAVDPGFGFGKTPQHNMQIMASLSLYHGLGVPVLLGVSRKSSIAHFSRGEAARDRQPGSTALAAMALGQGVQMIRVHDVPETVQALSCAEAMLLNSPG